MTNISLGVLALLIISSLTATALATTYVNGVKVPDKGTYTSSNGSTSVTTNTNTSSTSTSTCNSRVENHITVEVNGEKKEVNDVKEGCSVNSNVKVEAKSENGKTSISVNTSPTTTTQEPTKTPTQATASPTPSASNSASPVQVTTAKIQKANFWSGFGDFFKRIFTFFHFFSK